MKQALFRPLPDSDKMGYYFENQGRCSPNLRFIYAGHYYMNQGLLTLPLASLSMNTSMQDQLMFELLLGPWRY